MSIARAKIIFDFDLSNFAAVDKRGIVLERRWSEANGVNRCEKNIGESRRAHVHLVDTNRNSRLLRNCAANLYNFCSYSVLFHL